MSIINNGPTAGGDAAATAVPRRLTRRDASDRLIEAIVLVHQSRWAAPGLMVAARASHLAERLGAYLEWFRTSFGAEPEPVHLATATETILELRPIDGRPQKTASPWVLDSDFSQIFGLTTARFGELKGDSIDQL